MEQSVLRLGDTPHFVICFKTAYHSLLHPISPSHLETFPLKIDLEARARLGLQAFSYRCFSVRYRFK